METTTFCEYCHEKKAVATCEICGAKVCSEHKKDYGCSVCDGKMQFG